jgi:hypothetical protein
MAPEMYLKVIVLRSQMAGMAKANEEKKSLTMLSNEANGQ